MTDSSLPQNAGPSGDAEHPQSIHWHEKEETMIKEALAIDEASYGPNNPKVAIHLNNLAQLFQVTNRLAEAEPLIRRALAIDEANYGPGHPNVASNLNNLATLDV
jgi:hypothetical protein